jgi:uncharacterized protein YbcV (DUF1398 family)
MFDSEKIQVIHQKAAEKQWPFHYVLNSFKAMGIDRIETNVLTHEIKYVGGGTSLVTAAPAGFMPLTAATTFNLEAVKTAVAQLENREIEFIAFLSALAQAGVSFYRVDMRPRTVTYHGPTPRDKYVENVQQS